MPRLPLEGALFSYCHTAWREAAAGDWRWLRSCHRQELPLLKASHTREESNFRNRFWRPVPEPLGHGHIGRNPLSVDVRPAVPVERVGVEPTRPSGQTVFGTVAAANRLAPPNLATHCTISMQRSPGATRHSLQPKPPRCSAPVPCQILELHRDCGAGENRTPNARRQRCYRPRALHVLDTVEAIPDSRRPANRGHSSADVNPREAGSRHTMPCGDSA